MYFVLEQIAAFISIISLDDVVYGTLIAAVEFIRLELQRLHGRFNIQLLRVLRADLGAYLLLGLELLIAADIIKTILEPGYKELIVLAGIVVLRTVLSFFLNKEILEIDHERHEHPELFCKLQ